MVLFRIQYAVLLFILPAILPVCVYACACVVFPFTLDVRLVDVPAGVTQEEDHTGFSIHLLSAMLAAFIFLARRIQSFLSLVVLHMLGFFFLFLFVRENPSSCDCTGSRTHVPASDDFEEVTN